MKHPQLIFFIGIAVLLLPHLGFPRSWDTVMYTVAGAYLALSALRALWEAYAQHAAMLESEAEEAAYAQHDPHEARNENALRESVYVAAAKTEVPTEEDPASSSNTEAHLSTS